MPFSKYLENDGGTTANGVDAPRFSHAVQLQVPSFVYTSVPTLAPGGGAEVVTFNPSWFTSNDDFNKSTPSPIDSVPLVLPPPLGLPVYSASGFDLLSILARVAVRQNPSIVLGPVDLTCSFVVVDVRRHDHPIVYCSPSFCRLTGYTEAEILGRNCRFLQAPGGAVSRGSPRRFTSQQSIAIMHKALSADKEVQTTVVNYRKDGTAFINLVSVIPVFGGVSGAPEEANDVVWHVGFQVDLTEQPGAILDRVRDGTYILDQRHTARWNQQLGGSPQSNVRSDFSDKKKIPVATPPIVMSETLRTLLCNDSSGLGLFANAGGGSASASQNADPSHLLSLLLLSHTPDFIHVVSLKGAFLYVAPAVSRVLGYAPSELIGSSMTEFAHPEDVVPLERQLKEASVMISSTPGDFDGISDTPSMSTSVSVSPSSPSGLPRPVDLVFRARTKSGRFVWLECRGRLHVEPGKGRKAIILSGRSREIGSVLWGDVKAMSPSIVTTTVSIEADGEDTSPAECMEAEKTKGKRRTSNRDAESSLSSDKAEARPQPVRKTAIHIQPTEFWAMLGGLGAGAGALLSISNGVDDILGCSKDVLIGRRISDLVMGEMAIAAIDRTLAGWESLDRGELDDLGWSGEHGGVPMSTFPEGGAVQTLRCTMRTSAAGAVRVILILYRSSKPSSDIPEEVAAGVAAAYTILQVRLDSDSSPNLSQAAPMMNRPSTSWPAPSSSYGLLIDDRRCTYPVGLQPRIPTPVGSLATPPDPLLTHLPTDNMFAELEAERGSSWQYELQQMRYANQRLEEGIRELEEKLQAGNARDLEGGKGESVGVIKGLGSVEAMNVVNGSLASMNDRSGLRLDEMNTTNPLYYGADPSTGNGLTVFEERPPLLSAPMELGNYVACTNADGTTHLNYAYVDSVAVNMHQPFHPSNHPYGHGRGASLSGGVAVGMSFDFGATSGPASGVEQIYSHPEIPSGDFSVSLCGGDARSANGMGSYQRQNRQPYQPPQQDQTQQYRQHYGPDHPQQQLRAPPPPPPPQRLYAPVPLSAVMQHRRSSLIHGHGGSMKQPRVPIQDENYGSKQSHFFQHHHDVWGPIPPLSRRGVKRPLDLGL